MPGTRMKAVLLCSVVFAACSCRQASNQTPSASDALAKELRFMINIDNLCLKFYRKKQMEEDQADGHKKPLKLVCQIVPDEAAA